MQGFDAVKLWVQVAGLRDALESGDIALLTPEQFSHFKAALALLRHLDAEGCFEAAETVHATARYLDLTHDAKGGAPAPLVLQ